MTFYCDTCKHSRGTHAVPLATLSNIGPCKQCDCGEYISSGRIIRPYMFPFVFMFGMFMFFTIWSIAWFIHPGIQPVPILAPSIEYFAMVLVLIGSGYFAKRMVRKEEQQ